MALGDVTAEGVERAAAEFDRLRKEAFLDRYGFGRARTYFLVHGGRRYDSKAVVGVAHGFDRPDLGPLRPQDFSGGEATVAAHLRALADWAVVGLPAVAVVDEFEGDDQGDGEGELGEAVLGFSVGVSSKLAVVGQP